MFNRYLTVHRAGIQMTVFLAILSMSWLVGSYVVNALHESMLGFNPSNPETISQIKPGLANTLKVLEVFGLFIFLGLPALLFSYLAYPKPFTYLGLHKANVPLLMVLGGIVLLSALPLTAWLELVNSRLPGTESMKAFSKQYEALSTMMLSGTTWPDLLFNVFVIAITPALLEEIFFRGCLQQILLSWFKNKPLMPLLITAVVFSLFHFDMSGFIPRTFLGLLLGLGYYYSGSLWVPILMHFLNNAVAVVGYFLYKQHYISINLMDKTEHVPFVWILGSVSAMLFFGWLFLRNSEAQVAWEYNDEPQPENHDNTL
jgi:membrane protease YdiL (CAAX protease family)